MAHAQSTDRSELTKSRFLHFDPKQKEVAIEKMNIEDCILSEVEKIDEADRYQWYINHDICPSCKKPGLRHSEGCVQCRHCYWSACF